MGGARAWAAATLLVSVGCQPPVADERSSGAIEGVVVDALTEQPLVGARVRLRGRPDGVQTDDEGRFVLVAPVGEHLLLLDREGYLQGERAHVRVHPGERTPVDPRLFSARPRDADVRAYFARQPARRHAHPAHEPSAPPLEDDAGDVGRAVLPLDGLPETIRVWRAAGTPLRPTSSNGWADRSCDPEAVVQELPREEYVKGVLPHEWIPSWHPESLRAGAIAARTYAVRWAMRGGRWRCADVDDGTVTQVYRDDRSARASEAVDATAAMVVTRDGNVISTEYSAENADPTVHGVAEPTCAGTTRFGHGRGMCQWGTHRWASSICANPPCDFGPFGDAPKDHVWLVEHYYPGATLEGGEPAVPCAVLGPDGGVLEEDGPCFDRFGPAAYWRSVPGAGHGGHLLWTNAFEASSPSNWGRWRIHVEEPSTFRVAVFVDPEWGVWTETRYVVAHADGETTVTVDQGSSAGWVELGVFAFEERGSVRVEDSSPTRVPAEQRIVADALRLAPVLGEDAGLPADGGIESARLADDRPEEERRRRLTGCIASPPGEAPWALLGAPLAVLLARRRGR